MRISDWSSDVCSSDLNPSPATTPDPSLAQPVRFLPTVAVPCRTPASLMSGCLLGILFADAGTAIRPSTSAATTAIPTLLYRMGIGRAPCRERVGQYV